MSDLRAFVYHSMPRETLVRALAALGLKGKGETWEIKDIRRILLAEQLGMSKNTLALAREIEAEMDRQVAVKVRRRDARTHTAVFTKPLIKDEDRTPERLSTAAVIDRAKARAKRTLGHIVFGTDVIHHEPGHIDPTLRSVKKTITGAVSWSYEVELHTRMADGSTEIVKSSRGDIDGNVKDVLYAYFCKGIDVRKDARTGMLLVGGKSMSLAAAYAEVRGLPLRKVGGKTDGATE